MRRVGFCWLVAGLLLLAAPAAMAADAPSQDIVKRGEYLARAGDCFSCHTGTNGTPMAGGRQVETPYGTISSPNITPDHDTGIGKWSDDDFYKVMHQGLGRDGTYLYPVMPFDHYTLVTRDDAMAIKAYLFSLPPAHSPRPPSHLEFPFNVRTSLAAWRTLFFHEGTFKPDPARSDAENRGAYLVEGLGHCGACHTPRNALSGSKTGEALGGGEITGQGWFAPNISSDVREGIGAWSQQDLVDYLKKGVAPGKAVVAGPMAEVVHTSLQYLSDDDVNAIAAYLKVSPAKSLFPDRHLVSAPGAMEYLDNCAFCHQPDGKGISGAVPPLVGNGVVMAGGPQDVIRTILGGLAAHGQYGPMPGLGTALSSQQVADIANYVRTSWGNTAPTTATAAMADDLGKTTRTMLSGTGDCAKIEPESLATAVAAPTVTALLHQVDAGNMQQKIGAILPMLATSGAKPAQADLVNGLTAAYCPIVRANKAIKPDQRVEWLQRFATLVYSGVATAAPGQD